MMKRIAVLVLLFTPTLVFAKLPPRVQIAPPNEPGQRLVITGHVFGADGKPRRVMLYAYHTDARGLYRPDGSVQGEPRLRGTLLTAPDGSYEIDTIKPAPYPHRNIPAHIHVHLRRTPLDQEEEIRFEGSDRTICNARPDAAGVLRCVVDFHLRPDF
jgi:protocatechuate 3,4-dioxygenase beta subunit